MSPAHAQIPSVAVLDVDDRPAGRVELCRGAGEAAGLRRVGGPGLADACVPDLGRAQVEHAGLERLRDQVAGAQDGSHARPALALVTAAVLAVVVTGAPSLGAAEVQALGGALGGLLGGDGNGQINSFDRRYVDLKNHYNTYIKNMQVLTL